MRMQRPIHTMSITETAAASFALLHPKLFELWDQFMFGMAPENHFLHGHPKALGLQLPTTVGTLGIAERLGKLMRHPKIYDSELGMMIPVPVLGDLLLFLEDDKGAYCVDWDVKREDGDHGLPVREGQKKIALNKASRKSLFKDDLKTGLMDELGIRRVRISQNTFNSVFASNLTRLVAVHASCCKLQDELQLEIIEAFKDSLPKVQPPTDVIARFVRKGVSAEKIVEVLDQAIWSHRLEVDLFQELRTDVPLYPRASGRDPFVVYAQLFSRGSND